ncbi:MAG: 30S ribosomal protein S3, partial [Thermoplasmata archaeon]|nr:30S ribosomal protein S3 [Thermoplasmata archaeon]
NAQLMAEKLASTLERGWHFRRAGHSTVRRIMEAGARGCQVILSGKLTGARHRTERFKSGTIKYCGEAVHLHMDKGFYQARLKPGVIGVNVWIMSPTAKLPDEIKVKGAVERPAPVVIDLPPVEETEVAGVPAPPSAEGPI